MNRLLRISELAEKTGLSAHTLRFYEKHGLIDASQRSEAGYRLYTRADLRKAEFIRSARLAGFSLDDIATLLSIRLDKDSHTCEEVTEITRRKLDDVNGQIRELSAMRQTLETLLDSCCGGPENATHCSIIEALDARSGVSTEAVRGGAGKAAVNKV
jgi:MerR family Zn(II)-responsive transcriptional regulator of zntA